MELWFVENDPTTGPAATALERRSELLTERARRRGMRQTGPRIRVEHATNQLTDHVRRERLDVAIAGRRNPP